jgi:membrane protein DedA with SNARE-associated domain
MQSLLAWLIESIQTHGSTSVFLGVIIESVIIPLPSPLIIMAAGALLIAPDLAWPAAVWTILRVIVVPASVASTLGALIGYGIGYGGGKPLIQRSSRYLGFGWSDAQAMEARLSNGGGWLIAGLRALPVVPLSLISVAGGILRWRLPAFLGWTWLGSVPRCLLLGVLGWAARDAYEALAHRLDRIESLISGALVVAGLGVILWLRTRFRRAAGAAHPPK